MTLRVLIADDSPFFREVLGHLLRATGEVEIVGEARNGQEAVRMVSQLRPDVLTMDVVMPLQGGIDAVREIMRETPTPVVMLSGVATDKDRTLTALEAGAVAFFPKPERGFADEGLGNFMEVLKTAALAQLAPLSATPARAPDVESRRVHAVGMVISTGGPSLLAKVFAELPANLSFPILLVQHTLVGFTESLASWLGERSSLPLCIAKQGERAEAGTIYLAPDDRHLEIDANGHLRLSSAAPVASNRPSGTRLFLSMANAFGPNAAGVVLTGMGRDGSDGLRELEARGGLALVQDPQDALIGGMPEAALAATRRPRRFAASQLASLLGSLTSSRET